MTATPMPDPAGPLPAETVVEATFVAEALTQLLRAQGVQHVFLNPGTDTAPIQEALVALRDRGIDVPRVHLCPDERVALSAAQTYWMRTGQPQVVIVHVDVGMQNLGAALHNAQRTNSGVVIIAGTAPRTAEGELPGGRSIPVHWQQDQPDQIGIVRGAVKWAQELTLPETLAVLVPRAFQVARTAPAGPVFMSVAREVLMTPVDGVRVIPPARRRDPVPPAACQEGIATAAAWLAQAKRPIVVTSRLGRDPEAVPALRDLVDLLGAPVADAREYLNLESSHPCYLEDDEAVTEHLVASDLVLLIDVEVPWVPQLRRPAETARVVQVDRDPVKPSMVSWGFSVDLPLQADSRRALRQLLAALEPYATASRRQAWQERRAALAAHADERRRVGDAVAKEASTARPISPVALTRAVADVLADEALVLEEVTTNDLVVRRHLRREHPGSILAIGAAGLGWAPPGAIGACLAEPDREVVVLCGDGTFVFSSPVATLWAARKAGAAFLIVIYNNQGYRAAKLPVVGLFPDGRSVATSRFPGTSIDAAPDYAAVARACGAHGERVEDPSELIDALKRGQAAVRDGRCAVVDVQIERL